MHFGDTFNENSNRIQGSNHPEALSSKAAQVRNLQFCFGKEGLDVRARVNAVQEAPNRRRATNPDVLRRISYDGFPQKIADFLGGKIREK